MRDRSRIAAAMPHWHARIFDTPLAIEGGKLRAIIGAIGSRVVGSDIEIEGDTGSYADADLLTQQSGKKHALDIRDGVAVIPVRGTLVRRSGFMDALSGLRSYEAIASDLRMAAADASVKAILLDVDSGGGEVNGMFDLATQIREVGQTKRVVAVASDHAMSAAYLLASAASELYVAEGGMLGSIGIITAHVDTTGADEMAGVRITYFHEGERKADGLKPLTDESAAEFRNRVGSLQDLFTGKVADYRGIDQAAVKGTQSRVFVGVEGVNLGLADGVRSMRDVLAELSSGQQSLFKNTRTPAARVATANPPTSGGIKKEVAMSDIKGPEGGAAITEVQDRLSALEAENAKLKAKAEADAASLAAMKAAEKENLILAAQKPDRDGNVRVTPSMIPSLQKLGEHMDAKEFGEYLAGLPNVVHSVPAGVVAKDKDEASADPLAQLEAKAIEIRTANPSMTKAIAFTKACEIHPNLYAAHRAQHLAANTRR